VDGAQYQVLVFEGGKSAAIIYTLMKRDRNHVWRIEGLAAHGTPLRPIPKVFFSTSTLAATASTADQA
jgi:hypothetical protein